MSRSYDLLVERMILPPIQPYGEPIMLGFCYFFFLPIYIWATWDSSDMGLFVWIAGMFMPLFVYGAWHLFEAMQSGGEFSTYWKVLGRFYLQAFALCSLPIAIALNISSLIIPVLGGALVATTIIWYFMYYWMLAATEYIDPQTHEYHKQTHTDPWTEENDLNY